MGSIPVRVTKEGKSELFGHPNDSDFVFREKAVWYVWSTTYEKTCSLLWEHVFLFLCLSEIRKTKVTLTVNIRNGRHILYYPKDCGREKKWEKVSFFITKP